MSIFGGKKAAGTSANPQPDSTSQRHPPAFALSSGQNLGAAADRMSPSSSVRGLSPDWVTVRETILKRDNYRCVECGIPCTAAEADVHHLLPRSVGGSDEPSNLVTLCDGCHAAHHPKLAGRLARRVMEKWAVRLALWLDRHRRNIRRKPQFWSCLTSLRIRSISRRPAAGG